MKRHSVTTLQIVILELLSAYLYLKFISLNRRMRQSAECVHAADCRPNRYFLQVFIYKNKLYLKIVEPPGGGGLSYKMVGGARRKF